MQQCRLQKKQQKIQSVMIKIAEYERMIADAEKYLADRTARARELYQEYMKQK